jgi:hypothetical protein
MSQMPEIKSVVNKEPEREKKKGGLFGRLFGGGGSAGSYGAGGFGSAAGSGGLLATKAGLLALILAGTTVAGGIGMIGYRLFGPGGDQPLNGENLQLFAARPKDAPAGTVQIGSGKDGSSTSLQYLASANEQPKPAEGAGGEAPKDVTAAGAAGSASADAAAGGPLNKAGDGSNGVNKGLLKNKAAFGAMAAPSGGGGGGASASSQAQKSGFGDLSANAKKGTLTAMNKGPASALGAHSSARRFGATGAAQQGFAVLKDNRGAASSAGGGTTYDGSQAGSNIGNNGSGIGMPGVTTPGAGVTAKSTPAPSLNSNTSSSIPTPTATPEAPWQHAIQAAQMLLALGGILLFALSKLGKGNPTIYMLLNALVAVIAAGIIALGAQIANGQYGQKLQGGVLAAAGAGLMVAAAMAYADNPNTTTTPPTAPATPAPAATTGAAPAPAGPAATPAPASGTAASAEPWGINPYVLVGGGAALIGVAGTMMVPPTKYPASTFNGNPPPDLKLWGYQEFPSSAALKKMVA